MKNLLIVLLAAVLLLVLFTTWHAHPAQPTLAAGFQSKVPLSSLDQGGAATDQVIEWNGSTWAPGSGGGGGPITLSDMPLCDAGELYVTQSGAVTCRLNVTLSNLPVCDAGESAVTQNGVSTCQLSTSGVDAALSVPANTVTYGSVFPASGNNVVTREKACQSFHNGTCTVTLAVPQKTAGNVSVIMSGRQADGGANGGDAVWSCHVLNQTGTCKVYGACAATQAWTSTDAAAPWNPSVSISSCNITATGQGTDASVNTVDWNMVIQYANSQ
jgi:hypothetical protein